MAVRHVRDVRVAGQRVLVRADLNVPIHDGRITDTTRIDRFAAGIKPVLARGGRLVILTHLGRPSPGDTSDAFSTRQLVPTVAEALGLDEIGFADFGADALALSQRLRPGDAMLCENLRLHRGETSNKSGFAASLARLGDIYVNDAFSCSHRCHASMDALARLLPSAAGPLLAEEMAALTRALDTPERPAIAVVGGAKISGKIEILKNLSAKMDCIIIGGAMANTFLAAEGGDLGRSLFEPDQIETARRVMAEASGTGCQIVLPVDAVCARALEAGIRTVTVDADNCPADMMILDVGPRSTDRFGDVLRRARTLMWNGPLGAFEISPFDAATRRFAHLAAALTQSGSLISVAGGGDTVSALNSAGVGEAFSYVSTAGGAFLEWLQGRTLSSLVALERAEHFA